MIDQGVTERAETWGATSSRCLADAPLAGPIRRDALAGWAQNERSESSRAAWRRPDRHFGVQPISGAAPGDVGWSDRGAIADDVRVVTSDGGAYAPRNVLGRVRGRAGHCLPCLSPVRTLAAEAAARRPWRGVGPRSLTPCRWCRLGFARKHWRPQRISRQSTRWAPWIDMKNSETRADGSSPALPTPTRRRLYQAIVELPSRRDTRSSSRTSTAPCGSWPTGSTIAASSTTWRGCSRPRLGTNPARPAVAARPSTARNGR